MTLPVSFRFIKKFPQTCQDQKTAEELFQQGSIQVLTQSGE